MNGAIISAPKVKRMLMMWTVDGMKDKYQPIVEPSGCQHVMDCVYVKSSHESVPRNLCFPKPNMTRKRRKRLRKLESGAKVAITRHSNSKQSHGNHNIIPREFENDNRTEYTTNEAICP